jgi:hypothetical protein
MAVKKVPVADEFNFQGNVKDQLPQIGIDEILSPTKGDRYIVTTNDSGNQYKIALCTVGGATPSWEYIAVSAGFICYDESDDLFYKFISSWTELSPAETATTIAAIINGSSADTPLDADEWGFRDNVDSILKKITWTNIKSTLLTYFYSYFPKSDGSVNPVTIVHNGNFEQWSSGASSAPDYWLLGGAGASIASEVSIIKLGLYSAKLTRAGTDCYIYSRIDQEKGINYYKGRTITFSCWVDAAVADRAVIDIGQGGVGIHAYSSYHTGNSIYQCLSVTTTISSDATNIVLYLWCKNGDTSVYFDGAMCVEGSSQFAYSSAPINDPLIYSASGLTLKTTQYVSVIINGTVVKLATVN